ncbi:glycoside hydrolase family 61 protein [Pisolithus thermaeus]|nr:glycoside hydrolase family 61 protein [Pisolithus thermaeus]
MADIKERHVHGGLFSSLTPFAFCLSTRSVTIDGQAYQGNIPGGTTNPSIIRQVFDIDPVKCATNPSLNCGMNALWLQTSLIANPGSQILWPHNVGPVMHYVTQCSGPCSSFDSTNADWFKISELGLETSDTWFFFAWSLDVGAPANVTIPSKHRAWRLITALRKLSPLQLAVTVGGAEFYPACIQLSIGGSGTGAPQSSEVCQFPGCYNDTEAGIYTPNRQRPPTQSSVYSPSSSTSPSPVANAGSASPSSSPSAGSQSCTRSIKRSTNPQPHKRRSVRWRH